MATIRPIEEADLPAVESLLRAHLGGWSLDAEVLRQTVLAHPWADDECPSLIAESDSGEVVGFMGSQVRRLRRGEELLRGVCCTQLVVDPDARAGALGALMIKQMLNGPQDLTWSDSATDTVARIFQMFGGRVDYPRAADFMLAVRPGTWGWTLIKAILRRQQIDRRLVPVPGLPLQALGSLLPRLRPDPPPSTIRSESASAQQVVAALPTICSGLSLRVDWDEAELDHILGVVDRVEGGLVTRIVHSGSSPIGWYAYLSRPGGASRVLHLAARARSADLVLSELVADARGRGSAVVAGRAEPHLEEALRRQRAVLSFVRQPILRASGSELDATLASSTSLLTRLDGEVFAI
ncbi:MAG: hypothetical protein R2718_08305 [Solirubrobacterales bacterium]